MQNKGLARLLKIKDEQNVITKDDGLGNIIELCFSFNAISKEEEVLKLLKSYSFNFPLSYIDFLKRINGGTLYNYDNLDGYNFYSVNELKNINNSFTIEFSDDWDNNIFIFAECIGEGNYLGFRFKQESMEYEIIDCYHEDIPKDWESIEYDFNVFLDKLTHYKGKKYWLN